MSAEKVDDVIEPAQSRESISVEKGIIENDGEVFKRGEGLEDFRTVGWIHTAVIFLKGRHFPYLLSLWLPNAIQFSLTMCG